MRPSSRLNQTRNRLAQPDWIIAGLVIALIAFGVLMIFEASLVEAFHEIGDKWYFIRNQSQYALIGLVVATIALFFPIKKVESLALPLMISALIFLLIVLIPGLGEKVQGARRWLDLGFIRFQPSEYAKLASIIYLSAWFAKPRPARSFFLLTITLIGLIMLEPDLGTALVIGGTAAIMYFLSGVNLQKTLKIATIGLVGLILLIVVSPYRMNRVKTFMDPMHDPLGASYHARQILISLGSGGLTGTGLGRSRQKYQYLPEASTDSIFAVVGEEFGFVGAIVLIISLTIIGVRGLEHAKNISDPFIQNLVSGITVWLALQIILNLAAMVALVPLTGIPLPFISYGGSALIVTMAGVGLLLNATRYRRTNTVKKIPSRRRL